jgi:hypothetical protein
MTEAPPSLVSPQNIANLIEVASHCPPGALVEVGVYKGGTAWHLDQLAMRQKRDCFLYDTFTGIPYSGPDDWHKPGDLSDTDYELVCRAMTVSTVVKGIFPASAVPMGMVAFAHLDCDQYQSIIDACRYLEPLMITGGVIWFDDSPVLAGAEKAVRELYDGRIQEMNGKHFVRF